MAGLSELFLFVQTESLQSANATETSITRIRADPGAKDIIAIIGMVMEFGVMLLPARVLTVCLQGL